MLSKKPVILVLTLGGYEDIFASVDKHLIKHLNQRATVLTALTPTAALTAISTKPRGVLVTDPGITEKEHKAVLDKLVKYIKGGGNCVISSQFNTFMKLGRTFEEFFKDNWGVPWKAGSYYRTTHFIRPTRYPRLKKSLELVPSYSLKALHVKGIRPEDVVYGPVEGNVTQSKVFAATTVTDFDEAPVVYTQVGEGYLGYNGDVNAEEGTTWVVMFMLGLQ